MASSYDISHIYKQIYSGQAQRKRIDYRELMKAENSDGLRLRWDAAKFDWVLDEEPKTPEVNEFGPVQP